MNQHSEKYYLTPHGFLKFKKEYKKLLEARGSKLTDAEDLPRINERIEELDLILKSCEIIKLPVKEKSNVAILGATVVVEVDGQVDELTIVGTLEANPSLGKISNQSPVGKALLNRKIGEEVSVSSAIKTVYKIKGIKYENG